MCKQAGNNVRVACDILQLRLVRQYVRTCVCVWRARARGCVRERDIKMPPAFSLNRPLAVNPKSTLLWSLTGIDIDK